MVTAYLFFLTLASNPSPLHVRLEVMREQVRQDRAIGDEDRALLESKLAAVDSALAVFERLASQDEERKRQMAPVLIAGTALLADDATGVGTADDPPLLIVGLAAASVHARTQAPASDLELQAALGQLESAIDAAVQAGRAVLMSQQATSKIQGLSAHLARTLARILGRTVGGKSPIISRIPSVIAATGGWKPWRLSSSFRSTTSRQSSGLSG